MISINCDRCGDELVKPGGLLFGPPDGNGKATKRHLCVRCYAFIVVSLGCMAQR